LSWLNFSGGPDKKFHEVNLNNSKSTLKILFRYKIELNIHIFYFQRLLNKKLLFLAGPIFLKFFYYGLLIKNFMKVNLNIYITFLNMFRRLFLKINIYITKLKRLINIIAIFWRKMTQHFFWSAFRIFKEIMSLSKY